MAGSAANIEHDGDARHWTFLSNHGHIIVFLSRHPDARLRDIASNVGITERTVFKIISDLVEAGAVSIQKVGRANRYTVHSEIALRHPLEQHRSIADLIKLVG